MSQKKLDPNDGIREVPFGSLRDDNIGSRFAKNLVKTTKYTILTFLPLNTFEQLKKVGNFYFMVLSLILFIGEKTDLYEESLKAYSLFFTLVVMMAVTAVVAALDDYRRYKSDVEMNSQLANVVKGISDVQSVVWSDVQVGDILLVKSEEEFPADIVPFFCSGEEGSAYVSTANLDGETNLKLKSAPACTQSALSSGSDDEKAGDKRPMLDRAVEKLLRIGGTVKAEAPTVSIHNFTGALKLESFAEEALGAKQLLLRGTVLRNTAWCMGVVVYTGVDTRVVRNSRKSPMKLSNLERVVNVSMMVFLAAQVVMALISDICFVANSSSHESFWYLYPGETSDKNILPDFIAWFITFFGLYSNLIPISLYATVEICNAAQAFFIASDLEMFDRELNFPAMARSTNLCQEIGQVMYIFSDKTGTLTQNLMELKRVSISGEIYGHVTEDRGFHGEAAVKADLRKPARADAINGFLEVLAVSHTVMVTTDQSGAKRYEAESPDEDALVSTAAQLGWAFEGRMQTLAIIDVETDGKLRRQSYNICALNAFTSARKRMSVVAQKVPPAGSDQAPEYLLLVKGADNMMLARGVPAYPNLEAHLTMFAQEGLRTLVVGRRRIPEAEYASWIKEYEQAQRALVNRDDALAAVAEKIETDLDLLGATAIEDKLQIGVGDTIMKIRIAGVRLWVLTGDKLETARNIGYSTRVLSEEMEVLILDLAPDDTVENLQEEFNRCERVTHATEPAEGGSKTVGMMVTGAALELITATSNEARFLDIATRCSVLIACRVSPLQKAQMVGLVRKGVKPTPVTLAVGDGANDVPMIQEAQVGVGICGREGRQAVNAADFAIGQFRFLQRLLLVHGRLNYIRACKFTLYTYWRSAAQVLLMFYYSFVSGYSGISVFEDKTRMTFSMITSIPIISTGMFDRDMPDEMMLEHSSLYESGRLGLDLNTKKMTEEFLSAIVHTLIIYVAAVLAHPGMDIHGAGDYYSFGTAVYTCLIVVTTYRVAFMTASWNWASVASIVAALLLYAVGMAIYGYWLGLEPTMYMVPKHTANNLPFWIFMVAVLLMAAVVDFMLQYFRSEFFPESKDLIYEAVTSGKMMEITEEPPPVTLSEKPAVKPKLKSMSSFAFDHPLEVPRHNLAGSTHVSAGDTSLIDVQPATIGTKLPMESEGRAGSEGLSEKHVERTSFLGKKPRESLVEVHQPNSSNFAQQKIPAWSFRPAWWMVLVVNFSAGIVLVSVGAAAYSLSGAADQLRIQYDGEPADSPMGTESEEVVYNRCAHGAHGATETCIFNVTVPKDMEAPVLMYYGVEPFFQNYNRYVLTVYQKQLMGKSIDSSKLGRCKDTGSLKDKADQELVPCGLMATSVFNDTFELVALNGDSDISIDETGIAWESDVNRFANPEGYGQTGKPKRSWISDRYPSMPEGAKNEHFVVWMRPEAFPNVRKPYGWLRTSLRAGDKLTVRINASFPTAPLEARKELVLTTYTSFGGRDQSFGLYLLVVGCVCFFLGIVTLLIGKVCPRRLGERRTQRK